jgi:RNA polymerase sigma factor (sigma-70 family)
MVVAAAEPIDPAALQELCQLYWHPLYAYVRRRGYAVHDAQDLTQEFFARLLEKNWVARADEAKGRFRTFLLTAISRFLSNEREKNQATKRGGDRIMVPLPFDPAHPGVDQELVATGTPERAFERRWALSLLEQVVLRLEREFRASGQDEHFEALKPSLVGDGSSFSYQAVAKELGMRPGAVKVAAHRLRLRYRKLLREEIARTLVNPADVDSEMRHLFRALTFG